MQSYTSTKTIYFLRSCIEYLGHIIDKDSGHPTGAKVQAIKDAPQPTDETQLCSFLELLLITIANICPISRHTYSSVCSP